MADRTVRVSLVLEASGYIAGAQAAAAKTRELGSEAEKLAQKKQSFETLGRSALLLGAGMAAGVGIAVKSAADFDQAMSHVQAANHESAASMDLLAEGGDRGRPPDGVLGDGVGERGGGAREGGPVDVGHPRRCAHGCAEPRGGGRAGRRGRGRDRSCDPDAVPPRRRPGVARRGSPRGGCEQGAGLRR
jgi:hypothetical protein